MIVVKVGGSLGINYEAVCNDLASIIKTGLRFILVHGGSAETNLVSERLGRPPRMVTSVSGYESRYTDRETLEIFEMVYCGKINKGIVEKMQKRGIWEGIRKSAITIIEDGKRKVLRGDHTGRVERVNLDLIQLLLEHGYTPVLSPPAISYQGEAINVDGDRAAAILASALKAEKLIILSNVPGLLKDVTNESSLIKDIPFREIDNYVLYARGRMKKKVLGAVEAIRQGVKEVILADGRINKPISSDLIGSGTIIR
ncbi:MAG: acetylglutamate kinase [Acidobacteria bacterium]|nr:MAG: acetylglutamate kinase [Acidobacteriota bacterium]